MNANTIINDTMDLDAKLLAIDELMRENAKKFNIKNNLPIDAPVDPMDLPGMQCLSCQ